MWTKYIWRNYCDELDTNIDKNSVIILISW